MPKRQQQLAARRHSSGSEAAILSYLEENSVFLKKSISSDPLLHASLDFPESGRFHGNRHASPY